MKKILHTTSLPIQPPEDEQIYKSKGSNDTVSSSPIDYKRKKNLDAPI